MSLKDPVLARILAILAGVNAIGLAVARYVLPQLVPEFVPSAAILSVLLVVSLGIVLYFVRRGAIPHLPKNSWAAFAALPLGTSI